MTTRHATRTPILPGGALLVGLLIGAVVWFVATAPPAGAQDGASCDATVATTTRAVTDNDLARTVDAATRLENDHDATVRVRVTDTLPDGRPEAYLADALRDCDSWTDGDGNRNPRLVTIIVGLDDRSTGLFFGGVYSRLNRSEAAIQSDVMNPRFAEGDFGGGLTDGLDTINAELSAQSTVGPPAPSTPFPWGAVLKVVLVIALLAGASLLAWMAVAAHGRRRRRREEVAVLAARRSAVGENVYTLESDIDALEPELLIAAPHSDDQAQLNSERSRLDADFGALTAALSDFQTPDARTADDDALDAAETALDELERSVARISNQLTALRSTANDLAEFAATIPSELAERRERLAAAETAVTATAELGYNVDGYRSAAVEAATQLTSAEEAARSDRRYATREALTAVDEHLEHAASVESLPVRFQAAVTALTDAQRTRRQLDDAAASTGATLDALEQSWSPDALKTYRTHAAHAAKALTQAAVMLNRLELTPANFDSDVESELVATVRLLDEVAADIAAVDGAQDDLTRAAHSARTTLADAESTRQRVQSHRYGESVHTGAFTAAAAALAATRVNPFEADRLARSAAQDADSAWTSAESARRAAEAAEQRRRDEERRERQRREEERRRASSSSSSGFGGGSSSSFGGGGSSSSFGGGGSSSKW